MDEASRNYRMLFTYWSLLSSDFVRTTRSTSAPVFTGLDPSSPCPFDLSLVMCTRFSYPSSCGHTPLYRLRSIKLNKGCEKARPEEKPSKKFSECVKKLGCWSMRYTKYSAVHIQCKRNREYYMGMGTKKKLHGSFKQVEFVSHSLFRASPLPDFRIGHCSFQEGKKEPSELGGPEKKILTPAKNLLFKRNCDA